MSGRRDAILQRIRQAVADGNRAGVAPALPQRGSIGYQGAGANLLQRFCEQLTAAGGKPHAVADAEAAVAKILEVIKTKAARHVLLGGGPAVDALHLLERLQTVGLEVHSVDAVDPASRRDTFFQTDLGISGVAYAIAETGTLAIRSGPQDPRSLTLLPPVHIAIVRRDQIVPDLFDVFADLEVDKANLPSCITLITGPSKTGDIELRLVTGVHGPGEVHVVLIA
jgi:L-lactate utilization protein LutC